jgi:predicted nucleotidyltransferase
MRATPQSFLRQPLSVVLANSANVRVLRELTRHGGELSATTLTERSKLTKPSVLASLDHLAGLGYVEVLGSLHQRLYRIVAKHPLIPALSALFTAEDHRFQSIIEAIRTAAIGAGATAAWLYGSVARGEDRPGSDLDVALVFPGNAGSAKAKLRETLREREDALHFSISVLGFDADDIVRLSDENDPWWVEMAKDAVPLVGPDPIALASRLSVKQQGAA